MRSLRLPCVPIAILASACELGPLGPAAAFRTGVYAVDVTLDDGCGQVDVPDTPMDCHAGLEVDADGALVAAWPEVDAATYIVHDGTIPRITEEPALRWSTSGIEQSTTCEGAALRWIVTLSNDDEGAISGSLRNSWTGVATCPVTTEMPAMECTTTFAYRYTLEEPCEAPCSLVDAEAVDGAPYDCGLAACECP
jgi:hypothetical protein